MLKGFTFFLFGNCSKNVGYLCACLLLLKFSHVFGCWLLGVWSFTNMQKLATQFCIILENSAKYHWTSTSTHNFAEFCKTLQTSLITVAKRRQHYTTQCEHTNNISRRVVASVYIFQVVDSSLFTVKKNWLSIHAFTYWLIVLFLAISVVVCIIRYRSILGKLCIQLWSRYAHCYW